MLSHMLVGLVLAAGAAFVAFRAGALSLDGAAAAVPVGGLVYAAGGFAWASLLLLFFVSGSALSLFYSGTAVDHIVERGHRRDARQVLANGGAQAIASLGALALPSHVWFWAFAGATAAATADTWATELGRLSHSLPRLITSGRPVAPGTSGGVTPAGLTASLGGAFTIAIVAAALTGEDSALVIVVTACGVAGALFDSLAGALWQETRFCHACLLTTEQAVHRLCGTRTTHVGGVSGFDNDAVNALSVLVASLAAAAAAVVVS